MADTTKVRTIFRPEEEIEVPTHEAEVMRRQGFLYEGNATTDAGARRAVEQQTAANSKES